MTQQTQTELFNQFKSITAASSWEQSTKDIFTGALENFENVTVIIKSGEIDEKKSKVIDHIQKNVNFTITSLVTISCSSLWDIAPAPKL